MPKKVQPLLLFMMFGDDHRYLKAKRDCLSFVMLPATSAAHHSLLFSFFAAAVYSTISANKAGGMRR